MKLEQLQALAARCGKPRPEAFIEEPLCGANSSWISIVVLARDANGDQRLYQGSCSTLIAPRGDYLSVSMGSTEGVKP